MSRKSELKTQILRFLLTYGQATRPELVSWTGGRAATVMEAIDALKAEGTVVEPERTGIKTGRRAPKLFCLPECCHTIGVELCKEGVRAVICDARGKIVHSSDRMGGIQRGTSADAKKEILSSLQELREKSGENWAAVRGIGFADPGMVDHRRNRSLRAVTMPGWKDLPTGEWLGKVSGLPAGIWSGSAVRVRMEYLLRLPKAPETLFLLFFENGGIGGAFLRKGEIYCGSCGSAMEIGHIIVYPDGPLCRCGKHGCLEAVVAAAAEKRKTASMAAHLTAEVGHALATAATMLEPAMIVLGGKFPLPHEEWLPALRARLEEECFPETFRALTLENSRLAPLDVARGAAMMMRDRLMAAML